MAICVVLGLTSCKKKDSKESTESSKAPETTMEETTTAEETTTIEETTTVAETTAAFDDEAFVKKAIEITADNFKDSQRLDNVSKGQLVYFSGSVNGHNTSEKDDCLLINLSDKVGNAKLLIVTWNESDLNKINDDDIVTVYGEYVGESEWGTGTGIVVANDKVEAQHIVVTGKSDIYGPDKKFFKENIEFPTPVMILGSDKIVYDKAKSESGHYIYRFIDNSLDDKDKTKLIITYVKNLEYFDFIYEFPKFGGIQILEKDRAIASYCGLEDGEFSMIVMHGSNYILD